MLITIASIAAAVQAVALIVTIWIMIVNGRRQLRAYVLPENINIFDGTMVVPPQPLRANVPGIPMIIKNSGQTPAYKVVSWAQVAVILMRDENTALGMPSLIEDMFSNTLGPGSAFNKALWFDRPLSADEITDIFNGVRAIYFYGRIEYRDAFKKRRFTNFRLHYNGRFPPPPNAILLFSKEGNDSN